MHVAGRVVWACEPPEKAVESQASIGLWALHRAFGEFTDARSAIPGDFLLKDVLMDEYDLRVGGSSGGLYVKDITC